LQDDSRHPREYFDSFLAKEQREPQSICIWVGPEGDYTPAEMALLKSAGVLPITLGRLVLRCETAAIYCLSVLNYELGA
jgi:16S rRNA (uracil1498-N3)-methyltransferase